MGEDVSDIKLLPCAGGAECRKALMLLNSGRLPEDFVEGMMCPGGCVGGPSRLGAEKEITKARAGLLAKADRRKILENLENYPMDKFSMYRDGQLSDGQVLDVSGRPYGVRVRGFPKRTLNLQS